MKYFKNDQDLKDEKEWRLLTKKVSTENFVFMFQRKEQNFRLQKNEADYLHSIINDLTTFSVENPED
jgi:hypothetical protein